MNLKKGFKILVEGRLVFEQWTDQNGQNRSKHGVAVDSLQMLDSKNTDHSIISNQNKAISTSVPEYTIDDDSNHFDPSFTDEQIPF